MSTRLEVLAKLDARVAQVCAELAINIHAELVATTPVDTGWARSNWLPAIGAPPTIGGTRAEASIEPTADLGAVLAFKLSDGQIFVSNHVPYIRHLNFGHSKQAPADFVEAAIDKVLSEAQAGAVRA